MSDLITSGGAAITMTSLELVEFINSQRGADEAELRHDHFMAKVPKVLGAEHAPKFRDMIQVVVGNGATRSTPIHRFPKREACLMAMSYSYELQAKVFDRMTALEAQTVRPAIPQSLPEALRLAADLAEGKAKVEAALAIAAPKADALDLISAGDDALTFTQVAKLLSIKREKLTSHMHAQGWIYRQNDSWVAYQQHIQSGRLLYKEAHFTDQTTGMGRTSAYCHILPKGLALLARHFAVKETS